MFVVIHRKYRSGGRQKTFILDSSLHGASVVEMEAIFRDLRHRVATTIVCFPRTK